MRKYPLQSLATLFLVVAILLDKFSGLGDDYDPFVCRVDSLVAGGIVCKPGRMEGKEINGRKRWRYLREKSTR